MNRLSFKKHKGLNYQPFMYKIDQTSNTLQRSNLLHTLLNLR